VDRIILDTHVLLWLVFGNNSLGKKTNQFLKQPFNDGRLAVSAITFWEIGLLVSKNKLFLEEPPIEWGKKVLDLGINEYPVTGTIGIMSVELENFHADPADRIIMATALDLDCILVTADKPILKWKGALETWNARK